MEHQYRQLEKKFLKPSEWDLGFRQFLSFAETILEYLRKRGYNATFISRICPDRDPLKEPGRILPDSWKTDLDYHYQCKHYLYKGEAVFYGKQVVR